MPVRSACAVLVSSQDAERQWIYTQQQTVSAEGFAGTAFSPYFPHTVRSAETKQCTDCHLSGAEGQQRHHGAAPAAGDQLGQLHRPLRLGGNGRRRAGGRRRHRARGAAGRDRLDAPRTGLPRQLQQARQEQPRADTSATATKETCCDLQLRGEYLYAACGDDGFIAYDVANIDNKGFSERIITAPVSPLGQQFYVRSKYATCICSPSTLALDPDAASTPPENEEGVGHRDRHHREGHQQARPVAEPQSTRSTPSCTWPTAKKG